MILADIVAVVLFAGVTLYALLGGADFGSGFWDLIAGGPEKGKRPRALMDHAMGPVWEANHVWLIFVLVVLWSAFPRAFDAIMTTLYIPLFLVGFGIILRGASFAFRRSSVVLYRRQAFGAVFALSSVVTPFFLGAAMGGVASGRVTANGDDDIITSWVNPTSMLGGVLAVLSCAFVAAVYLVDWGRRTDAPDMVEYFRIRALVVGVVTGVVAIAGIFILQQDAEELFDGLTGVALPAVIVSALAGLALLYLLWTRNYPLTQPIAALAVVAIIWGWGVAQYPDLLVGSLTIDQAAAPDATLWFLVGVVGAAAVLVVPALVLLIVLTQRSVLEEIKDADIVARADRGGGA